MDVSYYRSPLDQCALLQKLVEEQALQIASLKERLGIQEPPAWASAVVESPPYSSILNLPCDIQKIISTYILYFRKQFVCKTFSIKELNQFCFNGKTEWRYKLDAIKYITRPQIRSLLPKMIEKFGDPMDPTHTLTYRPKYKIGDTIIIPSYSSKTAKEKIEFIFKNPNEIDMTYKYNRDIFEITRFEICIIRGLTEKQYKVDIIHTTRRGLGNTDTHQDNMPDVWYGTFNGHNHQDKMHRPNSPLSIFISMDSIISQNNYLNYRQFQAFDREINILEHPCLRYDGLETEQ